MSLHGHKETSRHALEMWSSNKADRSEEVFGENYVNHQEPDIRGGVSNINLKGWKDLVNGFHKSFSNAQLEVLSQIAEGELVATRWAITATQTGDYLGHAPTNKTVTWTGVEIDRFEDGKIAESWVDWDKYRFFDELGLVH